MYLTFRVYNFIFQCTTLLSGVQLYFPYTPTSVGHLKLSTLLSPTSPDSLADPRCIHVQQPRDRLTIVTEGSPVMDSTPPLWRVHRAHRRHACVCSHLLPLLLPPREHRGHVPLACCSQPFHIHVKPLQLRLVVYLDRAEQSNRALTHRRVVPRHGCR